MHGLRGTLGFQGDEVLDTSDRKYVYANAVPEKGCKMQ